MAASPVELTASAEETLGASLWATSIFIRGREHQEDHAVLAGGPLVDDFVVLVVQAEGVGNVVPRVAAVISAAVISTAAARDHDGDGR